MNRCKSGIYQLIYQFFFVAQLNSTKNGGIQIIGTSGVAVAMGFYHYLKYYCKGQRTWAGQQTQLPPTLPVISSPVKITTNDRYIIYAYSQLDLAVSFFVKCFANKSEFARDDCK